MDDRLAAPGNVHMEQGDAAGSYLVPAEFRQQIVNLVFNEGKLVDQDYQAIVRQPVVIVAATADRRFAVDTGRGGEVIGLAAPQRATSGPGNEALLSGQPDSTTLGGVEIEQLRGDIATSASQFDEYLPSTTSAIPATSASRGSPHLSPSGALQKTVTGRTC